VITNVAIKFEGVTYSLPRPNRHHHIIRLIADEIPGAHITQEWQGFTDDTGKFLGRREALEIALKLGQVKDPASIRCGTLFSEDLW
jgi:hypothetical protein